MRRILTVLGAVALLATAVWAQPYPVLLKYPRFVAPLATSGTPGTGTPFAVLVGVYNRADTAFPYAPRLVTGATSSGKQLFWIDTTSDVPAARNMWQADGYAYASRPLLRSGNTAADTVRVWTVAKCISPQPASYEVDTITFRVRVKGLTQNYDSPKDTIRVMNMTTSGNGGWLGGHIYQSGSGPKLPNYAVLAFGHDSIVGSGISEDNLINETFPADSGYFLLAVRSGQIDSLRVCDRNNFTSTSAPYTVIPRPWTVTPGCTTWVEPVLAYPTITAVTQIPQFPMSTDSTFISAQLSVSSGTIATDSLRYGSDTFTLLSRPHDNVISGTYYYSLVPQPAGSVIYYRIVAYSNLGYRTVSPAIACTVALDHSISTIQSVLGTGDSSADVGKIVHTTGIVNGFIRQDGSYERMFISDSAGGPWSGIYIHRSPPGSPAPLHVGDSLQIVGHVNEYFKQTEFENPRVIVSASGHGFDTTKITVAQSDTEPYEGVLVEIDTVRVIGDSTFFRLTATPPYVSCVYWATNPARSDSVRIYVTPSGGFVGTPVPPGYFTLIANMVQYNTDFQAYPRVPADVQRLYPDVATRSILAPVSPVIVGDTVSPRVTVKNLGTLNTAKSIPVTFDILGVWSGVITVDSLLPGEERTVVFPQWTASSPGSHTMQAYTLFANDPNRHDDTLVLPLQVLTHDLGVTGIDAPVGTIDTVSGVSPVARVKNFGTATDPYQAFFRILDALGNQAYLGSLSLPGLTPNKETTLTFDPWPLDAHPLGRYFTRCSTYISLDPTSANNVGNDSFAVLAAPVLTAPANGALNQPVTGTLQWDGVGNATGYDVYLGFDDPPTNLVSPNQPGLSFGYGGLANETTYYWKVAARHGNRPGSVGSETWHFRTAPLAPVVSIRRPRGGEHWTVGTTEIINWLAFGGTPDYDSLWYTTNGSTWLPIAETTGTCYPWLIPDAPTTTAQIRIRAENFAGACEITSGVFEITRTLTQPNVTITRPHGGESWVANTDELVTWDNSGGASDYDSLWYSRDGVAWTPIGEVISGNSYLWHVLNDPTTTARIRILSRNSVGASSDTSALFSITSTLLPPTVTVTAPNGGEVWQAGSAQTITCTHSGGTAATDSVGYSTDGGATWVFQFKQPAADAHLWVVPATPTARARVQVCAGNAAGPGHDESDADFVIYSPTTGSWVAAEVLPVGGKKKNVKDGGVLAYAEGAHDSNYVYAFKGNGTYEFYRYHIASNSWLARESIPALNRNSKKKGVKKGSSLVTVRKKLSDAPPDWQTMLYATKGNNTLDFWQYDPVGDGWTQKTDVPNGSKNVKEGASAVHVKIHFPGPGTDTNYVYFLKGSGTFEFYRYNTEANSWDLSLPAAPGGSSTKPFKNGSSLTYDGGDTIYCLKGSYNEFFAYSVSNRNWVTLDTLPRRAPGSTKKTKVKDGSQIASAGRVVYALKGGNTNEFWIYLCDSHRWQPGTDMTAGTKRVKGGGALVAASAVNVLFAFRGNNTREFWQYGPIGTFSYPLSAGNQPKDVQGQSAIRTSQFALHIAPNPFTTTTAINYTLPRPGNVSLKLYDVAGKLVGNLANGYRLAGSYNTELSATGGKLSAGMYLLKLDVESHTATSKLIVE